MPRPIPVRLVAVSVLVGLVACAGYTGLQGSIAGRVVAGPVCPVETDPPDPACAPRPVEGAEVTVITADGRRWVTRSDADGRFRIEVPVGQAVVSFGDVEGLMGTPVDIEVSVTEGVTSDLGEVADDTGIR